MSEFLLGFGACYLLTGFGFFCKLMYKERGQDWEIGEIAFALFVLVFIWPFITDPPR